MSNRLNFTFTYKISEKYSKQLLTLYQEAKHSSSKKGLKYIVIFNNSLYREDMFGLDKLIKEHNITFSIFNAYGIVLYNKEDLEILKHIMPLTIDIKIKTVLKISLLDRYKIACKKWQDQEEDMLNRLDPESVELFLNTTK